MYEEAIESFYHSSLSFKGSNLFKSLCMHLTRILSADIVFIGEMEHQNAESISSIAAIRRGAIIDNFKYSLKDTPCEVVVKKKPCCYQEGVCLLYPEDRMLRDMSIEGYAGVPLIDSYNQPRGILVALFNDKIVHPKETLIILKMYSTKILSEMLQGEQAVKC